MNQIRVFGKVFHKAEEKFPYHLPSNKLCLYLFPSHSLFKLEHPARQQLARSQPFLGTGRKLQADDGKRHLVQDTFRKGCREAEAFSCVLRKNKGFGQRDSILPFAAFLN